MIGFVQITGLDKRGKFRHQNISSPTTPKYSSSGNEEKEDTIDKTFEKYMDGVCKPTHSNYRDE